MFYFEDYVMAILSQTSTVA